VPIDFAGLRAALAERYALECELGHGTAATVYLAQDLRVGKKVAVKVLDPDLALAVRSERFLREMDYTARLNHTHILGITDRGVAYDPRSGREILYYVTPFAEEGSLADRIAKSGALPVSEALRLAEEVAEALEYAHGKGLIHRDIKPANILIVSGHACVADFGIARAIGAEEEKLTVTGGLMGTPAYMSPELDASRGIDHRVDLYALGCVLYEILTGRVPFEGPTFDHIALQRRSGPAPLVGKTRRVPKRVERLVAKALAMKVEDRFATAAEFRDAVDRVRRPAMVPVFAASGAAVLGALAAAFGPDLPVFRSPPLDPSTYAVLPTDGLDTAAATRLSAALHDALGQWAGITVVEQRRVMEAMPRSKPLSTARANRLARDVKAGRYLRAEIHRLGDSLNVRLALFQTADGGSVIRERSANVGLGPHDMEGRLDALLDRVLFTDSMSGGTRDFRAREAQEKGFALVREWDLRTADSTFSLATRYDPDFARAHLWLAQVRYWSGQPVATWTSPIERAVAGDSQLVGSENEVAAALQAFSRGDVLKSCESWSRLTRVRMTDFSAWFGLGTCHLADRAVVRDQRTLSGWRFRSSYQQGLRAFQRAYQLWPATHERLSAGGFESLRRLFLTSGNIARSGAGLAPDTGRFYGVPIWDHDSLVFVPFRVSEVRTGLPQRVSTGRTRGIQRLREMFHEVATSWRFANPSSPPAYEALAIALEMLGDPSCLDTLRHARDLSRRQSRSSSEQVRLAASEAWMRLKFAIPLDIAGIRAARALADSVLFARGGTIESEGPIVASLAVLTGRGELAATIAGQTTGLWRPAGAIASTAPSLLAYASLGGPVDSLRSLWRQVDAGINRLKADEQQPARNEWLGRAATLAFPTYPDAIAGLDVEGDYLVDAQKAYLRGDTAAVLAVLASVRDGLRKSNPPANITFDALYPEAWLLAEVGRAADAAAWLDPTLDAIVETPPRIFADPARAGSLVHGLALRAGLADRLGDHGAAARWARVVVLLWSDADPFLRPLFEKMQRLTGGGGSP
jgi:tRNA A-37 threonylcarbamoyl transferase component Bud32